MLSEALSAYPVGSYYWSSRPTSPQILFGGVWEPVSGRFLYAQDASHSAGSTGGEETHTLTVAEMPTHGKHTYPDGGWLDHGDTSYFLPTSKVSSYGNKPRGWTESYEGELYPAGQDLGGGAAHNNMPPYLAAYCWHRTA